MSVRWRTIVLGSSLLRLARPFGDITPSLASQPSPHFRVRSFGRFDEIVYLVEKTPDLTLAWRRRVRGVTLTATLHLPWFRCGPAGTSCTGVRCMHLTLPDFARSALQSVAASVWQFVLECRRQPSLTPWRPSPSKTGDSWRDSAEQRPPSLRSDPRYLIRILLKWHRNDLGDLNSRPPSTARVCFTAETSHDNRNDEHIEQDRANAKCDAPAQLRRLLRNGEETYTQSP